MTVGTLTAELTGCPVCQRSSAVSRMDTLISLFRCASCDHTFTVKAKEDLEVYEERYYLEKHPNWFANPNYGLFDQVYRMIRQYHPKPEAKLLDVGCGNGDLLKYYARKKYPFQLCGIDSLKLEHEGVRFIQGDFFVEDLKDRFDILISLMVIEHVHDPKRFTERLYECLHPGGLLIISTNNNGGLLYGIARWLKALGLRTAFDRVYSDHHLQHFTNGSLRKVLETNGFEVQRMWNHNYPMRAVDTPSANPVVRNLYLLAVMTVFRVSELFGNGFLQTFVARRPASSGRGSN